MNGNTSERAVADLIVDLLQHFYHDPARYRAQALGATEVIGDMNVVLRIALRRPVQSTISMLRGQAPVAELELAAVFFIRHCLLREDATHYEVLGLNRDAAPDSVRENFRLLMQLIHPDRHAADSSWPEILSTRANRAYSVLKNPRTRTAYDSELEQPSKPAAAPTVAAAEPRVAPAIPKPQWLPPKRVLLIPMLPEWLTTHAGGFVRERPALAALVGTMSVSILAIALVAWSEHESVLTRVVSVPPIEGAVPRSPLDSPSPAADARSDGTRSTVASSSKDPPGAAAAAAASPAPVAAEVELLVSKLASSFAMGRVDAVVLLFDLDAETDLQRGRAAIRSDYDQLFRSTAWRRMNVSGLSVNPSGDHTQATGEITTRIGWRDGREVEERATIDMQLVRRDGRAVITRLSLQPKN